jgi:hypothetical protein
MHDGEVRTFLLLKLAAEYRCIRLSRLACARDKRRRFLVNRRGCGRGHCRSCHRTFAAQCDLFGLKQVNPRIARGERDMCRCERAATCCERLLELLNLIGVVIEQSVVVARVHIVVVANANVRRTHRVGACDECAQLVIAEVEVGIIVLTPLRVNLVVFIAASPRAAVVATAAMLVHAWRRVCVDDHAAERARGAAPELNTAGFVAARANQRTARSQTRNKWSGIMN